MDDDYISAHDVADFVYCQRHWWLRLQGIVTPETPAMQRGSVQHEALAQEVQQVEQQRRSGTALVWIGIGLALLIVVFKLMTGA